MPNLTAAEAAARLATTPATLEALQALVADTRTTQVPTSFRIKEMPLSEATTDFTGGRRATLLYSGEIAQNYFGPDKSLKGVNVAAALTAADPSLFTIDRTHVGALLASDEFENKMQAAFDAAGLDQDDLGKLLYGADGGFWSNASQRFAAEASGNIVVIAPNPASIDPERSFNDGIFSKVELATLLNGSQTGQINGMSLGELRAHYSARLASPDMAVRDAALVDLTEVVAAKSMGDMWSNLEIAEAGDGAITVNATQRFFEHAGMSGSPAVVSAGFDATAAQPVHALYKGVTVQEFDRLVRTAGLLDGWRRAGKYAGPVGDIIELAALGATLVAYWWPAGRVAGPSTGLRY
jgi:hypothetical protein